MVLNVIGCGNLGRVLCRLWHQSGTFQIGCVRNRSLESAQSAVAFIGAGVAIADDAALTPADATLIGTPDDAIEAAAARLAACGVLRPGDVVFHCSGSLSSETLFPVRARGAHVASAHPIHSFADPLRSVAEGGFAGTFCALEGDPEAVPLLRDVFTAVGAQVFPIESAQKSVYHAGTVFAANYLVALLEVSRRCLEQAGVPQEQALAVLGPLVGHTADNVFAKGTTRALSGPIARGDAGVVARQLDSLAAWDPEIAALYRHLGRVATGLSQQQGTASAEALARIRELLAE